MRNAIITVFILATILAIGSKVGTGGASGANQVEDAAESARYNSATVVP